MTTSNSYTSIISTPAVGAKRGGGKQSVTLSIHGDRFEMDAGTARVLASDLEKKANLMEDTHD